MAASVTFVAALVQNAVCVCVCDPHKREWDFSEHNFVYQNPLVIVKSFFEGKNG